MLFYDSYTCRNMEAVKNGYKPLTDNKAQFTTEQFNHIRLLVSITDDTHKVACIKVIRGLMNIGLKEAKDLYDEAYRLEKLS